MYYFAKRTQNFSALPRFVKRIIQDPFSAMLVILVLIIARPLFQTLYFCIHKLNTFIYIKCYSYWLRSLTHAHANAFSFENAYASKRLGLPFTIRLWARFHRQCIDLKTRFSVNCRNAGACVLVCAKSSTCVTMRNSAVFERSSVDSRKRIINGSVDTIRSMRFRWRRKSFILLKTR